MIRFDFQKSFPFHPTLGHKQWIKEVIRRENRVPGDVTYLFCDDDYVFQNNVHFLNHDTLTDIITFDECEGDWVQGSILISFDRVMENAEKFNVNLNDEILRVLAHGVLHLCGYKDKTEAEAATMRSKENEAISMYYKMLNNQNQ